MVAALGRPFALAEGSATVRVGASVGIATSADAADVGGILHCADLALFAAKAVVFAAVSLVTIPLPPVRNQAISAGP